MMKETKILSTSIELSHVGAWDKRKNVYHYIYILLLFQWLIFSRTLSVEKILKNEKAQYWKVLKLTLV